MMEEADPLSSFHPLVAGWFRDRFHSPTEIQTLAWPLIADGRNVLITAPTGSGKTLTAFLSALERLLSGEWETGSTSVLYVSPLKALNNDVQRNLLAPLSELRDAFAAAGVGAPGIEVLTRSGDTPQRDRRRMVRRPPEILITTPESLNLIVSSVRGRRILTGVRCVILDEVHAVAGTKRGTHLMTAVERLTLLSGEFQRIAISATVRPMNRIAEMVAGYRHTGGESYDQRPITVVESAATKELSLSVRFVGGAQPGRSGGPTGAAGGEPDEDSLWETLTEEFRDLIARHSSTLFFVNTRRHAEKISLFLNEGLDREIAYAHHGSLAKEIRRLVEEKLKSGELSAIVATSSLELGIDIGDLDLVVMVGSPNSVASGLQRIGRSGHRVGETSRGFIYPLHGRDIVDAAVISRAILAKDIEETAPVLAPLDVLAQVLLAMTAVDVWDIDELYAFVRTAYAYHTLSRRQFDLVLMMLAGRYADSRIRELKPRVYIDRFENTVKAAEGSINLVYLSGGTIPDRGYYGLKRSGAQGTIGELDEEFVWERNLGDTFTLGAQMWTITSIGDRDVEVQPASNPINIIPFWRAEAMNRDFHYCERILCALEEWNTVLNGLPPGDGGTDARSEAVVVAGDRAAAAAEDRPGDDHGLERRLEESYNLDRRAAEALVSFLERQREITGRDLPHRHHILMEHYTDPLDRRGTAHLIIHTLWGGRINRPLALLLEAAWEEEYGYPIETFADNDSILLMLPNEADESLVEAMLRDVHLADERRMHALLRRKLESSGLFGGRFRENAGRALLLPRASFKQRMPLWLTRLRSKKLLAAVSRYDDFPVLAETWRTCLNDEFDLPRLSDLLSEVQTGRVRIDWTKTTAPSPFTRGLVWQKTNKYMYQGDEPRASGPSSMGEDLLKEVLHSARLRPRVPRRLVDTFEAKLKRTYPGYAPTSADDLVQFVQDRRAVPSDEWEELLSAIRNDEPGVDILREAADRLVEFALPGARQMVVSTTDVAPELWHAVTGWTPDPEDRRFYDWVEEHVRGISIDGGMPEPGLDPARRNRLDYAVRTMAARAQITADAEPTVSDEPAVVSGVLDTESIEIGIPGTVAGYLAFTGPIRPAQLAGIFGLTEERIRRELAGMEQDGTVIVDNLIEDDESTYVCDTENLEILLRITRSAARPDFQARPVEELQEFLADHQGLVRRGAEPEDLEERLERLFGFPLPVELWETDVIPARMRVYYKAWLDSLLGQSELIWLGCGEKTATFVLQEERGLFSKGESRLFPKSYGSYSFWDIKDHTGLSATELTERLWQDAWEGRCTTDGFEAVRRGIAAGFVAEHVDDGRGTPASDGAGPGPRRPRRRSRSGFRSWKSSRPVVGRWIPFPPEEDLDDLVALEEENKDRVRQLLDRYGVVFRELLSHELPSFGWSKLFRTLRLMELSGEILAGQFFEGIRGLQFIRPDGLERLRLGLSEDAVYWMNACDPASLCGRAPDDLPVDLPARIPSNYMVFRGSVLVVTAKRRGKDLTIAAEPGDPRMNEYLGFFRDLATRDFDPLDRVTVEIVNDVPTRESPYADALVAFGFVRDYKAFHLRPTFGR